MKRILFLGDSLKRLRAFPTEVKQSAGHQLFRLQMGSQPENFKPIPRIGSGVEAIRIHEESGQYRVIYVARLSEVVAVLHVFQKKTRAIPDADVNLAKDRYLELMRTR